MNPKARWRLPDAPLRWSLVFALTLITTIPSLAQYDGLTDADKCYLGQTKYCRDAPKAEAAKKAEEEEEVEGESEGKIVSVEREFVSTCPLLPPSVAVSGYNIHTQCQIVDSAGVGRMDLIKRGVISAVDVWGNVNSSVEVCFQNIGVLVFLDADYAPRMLSEMETYERDGMTCGAISGHGTVALLPHPPPIAPAPAEEAPAALPIIEEVAAESCQIKLTETLFLRAEPSGDIIGLVWLNSEVPVFETIGMWHKTAFQGQTGYISREYRRVLRGDCG